MNELNRHKKSDKIKWVMTCIAFLLVFVFLIGLTIQLFGNEKLKPSNWFNKTEQTETPPEDIEEDNGGAIVTDVESRGISLMSKAIAVEDYADYGISPQADSAILITATITPVNASVQDIVWSCGWTNENSAWASGKNISDYYGFTGYNTLTTQAVCYKPFSETIWVRATSVDNPDVSATATAHYVKRLTPSFELQGVSGTVDYDGSYVFNLTESYSEGTVMGTVKYSNLKHVYTSASGGSQLFGDLEDAIYHEYNETKQPSDPHMDSCNFNYDGWQYEDDYLNDYMITNEEDMVFSPYVVFDCISDAGKKLTNQRITNAKANQLYRQCGADKLLVTVSFDYIYTYNGATYNSGTLSKTYTFDCTSMGVKVTGMSFNKTALIH